MTGSSAGVHQNHGHGGDAEVSETKAGVEADLSAGGKHEHGHEQLHACIGVSLVLGFVFMLLVDQIGSSHVHSTEGQSLLTAEVFLLVLLSSRHKAVSPLQRFRSRVGESGLLENHHHPGSGGPCCRWDTHWFLSDVKPSFLVCPEVFFLLHKKL